MKFLSVVFTVVVLVGCSSANSDIDRTEFTDTEKSVEFEVQTIAAQAARQSIIDSTAQAPTLTPKPTATPRPTVTPTSAPTSTPAPTAPPSPTATPTVTPKPTPIPTQTPKPTPTPVPRLLGQQYLSADGVNVTLTSLDVTGVGFSTTVLIEYTLKNTTSETKEEKAWKLFYQGSGGIYFGALGELLPNQSIDRSFTLSASAPNGLLVLAYPSEFSDTSWDGDDLVWNVTALTLP